MKRDTQKPFQNQARRTRKVLRLDRETLRRLNGGGQDPEMAPTFLPSICPLRCA